MRAGEVASLGPSDAAGTPDASGRADRARNPGGPTQVEQSIVEAVERLLGQVALHELTVPVILTESGISRRTFYMYFSSKNAAVTAVIARTMDEILARAQPWIDDDGVTVADTLRATLEGTALAWETHAAALRCLVENWHVVPELGDIWQANVDRFVDAISGRIDADRAAGLAPPGIDSRKLAAGLIWNGQQFFYLGSQGVDPRMPTIKDAVGIMYAMWFGAIYGTGSAPQR